MLAHQGKHAAAQRLLEEALAVVHQTGDAEASQEIQARLDLLAAGTTELPEPPATMQWVRTHVVLTEGKVYCEYELPALTGRRG
jgi:hypothetical protein